MESESKNGSEDRMLNKREASARLGVCTRTIERLVTTGRLRAFKPTFGIYRIRESDLTKFIEAGSTIAS
jgi:excisionase family DNA binding protein